ncbi:reductase [Escherichia sp. E2748]|nr:reductase [Escherichia sp. E4742]RZM98241.1 reductase [Escherichia sp. E14V5]RZN01936.1 reductase [Escherichia sp. E14V7]RZN22015.1 reductase [Escherichia sp. E14S1]RZN26528.1 reductase [Escherichia sp. E14V10]RZN42310.1 reductase [Escherichia sp. E10V5]RZN52653.1 reductase [Escherichia sp. E10V10]TBR65799.1 reductase [Escherichia sp. E10V4]TLI72083.1 reductase [Escherichia sp. E1130]TLI73231.1 reductase [Escherichia sp. E2586]TLI84033.1 reductase [Escherichia sp. E2562]TLI87135.1 red
MKKSCQFYNSLIFIGAVKTGCTIYGATSPVCTILGRQSGAQK